MTGPEDLGDLQAAGESVPVGSVPETAVPGGDTPTAARQRLARISHHFLSEARPPRCLHLLQPDRSRPHAGDMPLALARALCRAGFAVVTLAGHAGDIQAECRHPGADPGAGSLALRTWRPGELPPADADHLLLFAEPTTEGLEQAYLLCKRLLVRQAPAWLGVTLCHCADLAEAQQAYRRLATAARRFLDAAPASCGYLPTRRDESLWESQLRNVAALLAEDLAPSATPQRQAPPRTAQETTAAPSDSASAATKPD